MDIIDVILAKALTPQGQIESYAQQARNAVTNANSAVETATTAANTAAEAASKLENLEIKNLMMRLIKLYMNY